MSLEQNKKLFIITLVMALVLAVFARVTHYKLFAYMSQIDIILCGLFGLILAVRIKKSFTEEFYNSLSNGEKCINHEE